MHRRLAVLLAAALTLAAAPHADAAERREPASITVQTWGWGHGKGLSQYGAKNRAEAGQTYRQIVEHYYPGTSWDTAAGKIRVLLTDDTSDDVLVDARPGLKLRPAGGKATTLPATVGNKTVKRWRIKASGSDSVVSYRASRWKVWDTVPGDAEFAAGNKPITLRTPEGTAQYRGVLRSASAGTGRDTVNVVGLEAYLRGVVAREIPALWSPEAVKSQSIAARTYAAFERADAGSRYYDLCDTSHCQVYGGYDDEHPSATAAIKATAREILTYGGEPAFTQFSASNGGHSAAGSFPYLVAEADPFDHGYPGDPQTKTFTGPQVTKHWTGLGDLVSVTVTEEGPAGEHGGRVLEVRIEGTLRTQVTTGSAFASFLGLRSTIFDVSPA
jgi:SpoIID/LytB domain protein